MQKELKGWRINVWWFLKKTEDNDTSVIYAYGCETGTTTGEVVFDKKHQNVLSENLLKTIQ